MADEKFDKASANSTFVNTEGQYPKVDIQQLIELVNSIEPIKPAVIITTKDVYVLLLLEFEKRGCLKMGIPKGPPCEQPFSGIPVQEYGDCDSAEEAAKEYEDEGYEVLRIYSTSKKEKKSGHRTLCTV